MCADMCVDMRVDMCADMCADMRVDMCTDMCANMREDMCPRRCTDMRTDACKGASKHASMRKQRCVQDPRIHMRSVDLHRP